MIRPVDFGFNEQTAESNAFQNMDDDPQRVQQRALREFDAFVNTLRQNGVDVTVFNDTLVPHSPDSIFPNNWVTFHDNGEVFLYPMLAENRRLERREDIIIQLQDNFYIEHVIDLSHHEAEGKFLEGTGSMVLDRDHRIAYACLSPRTDKEVLNDFCAQTGYRAVCFYAHDQNDIPVYHTNVMMCMGSRFSVICLDAINDTSEKDAVIRCLQETEKQIIDISFEQMNQFAGNMLEVKNKDGETLIVMSQTAYESLTGEQRMQLEQYGRLVYADINAIETNGGGSARCMMAEVHLPELKKDE
ncbi:citrulline utilization hydrolase CtlX [Mucilaginibacter segetis]|nr:arginine deiminase-related protein [Mucilaginibacter segetis]